MFSFRSNRFVAIVAIAGLLSAQFATVTHSHADEMSAAKHAGRPHVHTGYGHAHSHAHGHKHGHGLHKHVGACSAAHPTFITKRSVAASVGFAKAASEHDRDAVYLSGDLLCTTTQPSISKSTSGELPDSANSGALMPTVRVSAWYGHHPPALAPPRAIYRLNQAILC